MQAVVGNYVGLHGVVTVAIFSVDKLAKVVLTRTVNLILMVSLQGLSRVAEDLAVINQLCLLGLREALVEHVLIVLDDGVVSAELVIESILRVRQNVSLVSRRRHMRLVSVWHGRHVILTQVRVEGPLRVGGAVVGAQAARAIGDVGVATAAIVHVNDGLGVDVCQVVPWTLLQESKRA